MARTRRRKALVAGALLVVVLAGLWTLALVATGRTKFVVTHGVSMNPVYYQGDLVVVARAPSYRIGEIAAYRVPGASTVVLHRIIGGSPAGYVFKGDNNQSTDLAHPTVRQLLGHPVLHVPQAGAWLHRLTSPTGIAVAVFLLSVTGGTAVHTRRRGRRNTDMPRRASNITTEPKRRLPPAAKVAAWAAVDFGLLGLLLAAAAWSGPSQTSTMKTAPAPGRVVFSYSAAVGHSAAYDSTVVRSPDPVFRRRADTVTVAYDYAGPATHFSTSAVLSTTSGWHATVSLPAARRPTNTSQTGPARSGAVDLHLAALTARAQAAAAATGLAADPVTIAVTVTARTDLGRAFRAALTLSLTPLQLTVPGGRAGLTVTNSATIARLVTSPRTLSLFGSRIGVITVRAVSAILIGIAVLIVIWVTRLMRRIRRENEQTEIGHRYPHLIVLIDPAPEPVPGRPINDVSDFPTLARLAEHYDLLILQSGVPEGVSFQTTFEGNTYRYLALRRGPNPRTRASDFAGPQPDRRTTPGPERRGGSAEDRRGGSAEDRRGGSAEDRRGGSAEDRRGGSAEDRRGGSAEDRHGGSAED